MGKHTGFLGFSKVAWSWREAYETCNVGDDFIKVKKIAGEPDETLDLGDSVLYEYVSEEWKGLLRGGTVIRSMRFVVKDGKIISKSGRNLDMISG